MRVIQNVGNALDDAIDDASKGPTELVRFLVLLVFYVFLAGSVAALVAGYVGSLISASGWK